MFYYESSLAVFVYLVGIQIVSLRTSHLDSVGHWQEFKSKYNKTYNNEKEEYLRFNIWRENLAYISLHNVKADRGDHSYWMGVNAFTDLTDEEFYGNMLGIDKEVELEGETTTEDSYDRLPASVDWREKGYVTPVKFQGACGSCYAFSATGALEGQHFRKTGDLVSLSEQNIVDCTFNSYYRNHGCHGGLMDHAFKYVIDNHGVDTERAYPYNAEVGLRCKYSNKSRGATAVSYRDVLPRGDEYSLKKAVATIGPISIGVDARHGLRHYWRGFFESSECNSHKLNHAVLIVGYGTEGGRSWWNNVPKDHYWIIKNSWGAFWGENGYFRLARNFRNMCGVASLASYPIV